MLLNGATSWSMVTYRVALAAGLSVYFFFAGLLSAEATSAVCRPLPSYSASTVPARIAWSNCVGFQSVFTVISSGSAGSFGSLAALQYGLRASVMFLPAVYAESMYGPEETTLVPVYFNPPVFAFWSTSVGTGAV